MKKINVSLCRFRNKYLKPHLRVYLASHTVAMVKCNVIEMMAMVSPVIGQFFDMVSVGKLLLEQYLLFSLTYFGVSF